MIHQRIFKIGGRIMKKFIFFIAAMSALLSCVKENPVSDTPVVDMPVVETPAEETFCVELKATAPSDGDDAVAAHANTKTTLVEGGKFVHWSKGDAIKVLFFPGRHGNEITGPSGKFASHFDEESSASANFRTENWNFGMDQSYVNARLYSKGIAVYPSSANASSTKASGSYANNVSDVSFTLPSEQKAIENNIESNLNFSYADVDLASFTNTINNPSHQTKLSFKNVCALIQLTMPAQMPKVTEIVLTSNDKVALTGHGSMNYTNKYNQEVNGTVTVTDGGNVVLKNADGFKAGATYFAVVWPGVHNSGLTIEFMAEDGTVATKTTPSVTLTASYVKPYTFNKDLEFEAQAMDYDYYYSDGSVGTDPKPSGKSVVGVVFYKGNPRDYDPSLPENCTHGLAISLVEKTGISWHSSNLSDDAFKNYGLNNTGSGLWGFTAKDLWKNSVGVNLSVFSSLTHSTFGTLPYLGEYVSSTGWYLPAGGEWDYIAKNLSDIDAKFEACGAQKIHSTTSATSSTEGYLSPLASSKFNIYIVFVRPTNVLAWGSQSRSWATYYRVRPIFAF